MTLDSIKVERGYACPIEGCGYIAPFDPDSQMDVNRAEADLSTHMKRPKGKFKVEEHEQMKGVLFS